VPFLYAGYRRLVRVVAVLACVGLVAILISRMGGDVVQVGLPLPPPPAPEIAVSDTFEFSVVSYNVQSRPWLDDTAEKLPKISPLLAGHDVVAVQECFENHALLWASSGYPNRAYFGSLVHPFKLANSGLSTLSRLPMGDVVMEHYRRHGELQNRVASKGILMTRFQAGQWTLDVYNTHMEAGGKPEAQPARMDQARQVVELVTRNSPPEHAVILCGDFNMMPLRADRGSAEYNPKHFDSEEDWRGRTAAFQVMFEGLGLRDASDELFGPTREDIERFLFRAPAGAELTPLSLEQDHQRFRREDGSALSDGSPYIARFRLSKANMAESAAP
jgi:endonuclease/exonuclease/phosphatase family metal-dependent hydrolase